MASRSGINRSTPSPRWSTSSTRRSPPKSTLERDEHTTAPRPTPPPPKPEPAKLEPAQPEAKPEPPKPEPPKPEPMVVVPTPAPMPAPIPKPAPAPVPTVAPSGPPPLVAPTAVTKVAGDVPNLNASRGSEIPLVIAAKLCIDVTGRVTSRRRRVQAGGYAERSATTSAAGATPVPPGRCRRRRVLRGQSHAPPARRRPARAVPVLARPIAVLQKTYDGASCDRRRGTRTPVFMCEASATVRGRRQRRTHARARCMNGKLERRAPGNRRRRDRLLELRAGRVQGRASARRASIDDRRREVGPSAAKSTAHAGPAHGHEAGHEAVSKATSRPRRRRYGFSATTTPWNMSMPHANADLAGLRHGDRDLDRLVHRQIDELAVGRLELRDALAVHRAREHELELLARLAGDLRRRVAVLVRPRSRSVRVPSAPSCRVAARATAVGAAGLSPRASSFLQATNSDEARAATSSARIMRATVALRSARRADTAPVGLVRSSANGSAQFSNCRMPSSANRARWRSTEQIHLLDRRDDLREQHLPEHHLALVVERDVHALLRRQARASPTPPGTGSDRASAARPRSTKSSRSRFTASGCSAIVVAQRQHAERDVARLVAHHVRGELP